MYFIGICHVVNSFSVPMSECDPIRAMEVMTWAMMWGSLDTVTSVLM